MRESNIADEVDGRSEEAFRLIEHKREMPGKQKGRLTSNSGYNSNKRSKRGFGEVLEKTDVSCGIRSFTLKIILKENRVIFLLLILLKFVSLQFV